MLDKTADQQNADETPDEDVKAEGDKAPETAPTDDSGAQEAPAETDGDAATETASDSSAEASSDKANAADEPAAEETSADGDEEGDPGEDSGPSNELIVVEQEPEGPRVLMVVKSLDSSQSGTSAFNMASHLAAAKLPVTVMSQGGRNLKTLLQRKVTHIEWRAPGDGMIGRVRASRRLSQAMDASNAEIIHTFGRIAPGPARSAADKRRGRMIVSVPGILDLNGWGVRSRTQTMTSADHLIVPSRYVQLWLKDEFGVPEDKVSVIAPGVDMAHFNPGAVKAQRMIELARHHGVPEEDQVVLMPARMIQSKGHRTAIKAFQTLGRENTTLIIAGDATLDRRYADALQHMVEEERLADKVRFVGHVDDMPALYMLSDVVIEAPTQPVAFARTSVEAQAMGRPVVTSAIGGGPDSVVEGETGWLAPPRDEEAITKALDAALSLDTPERKMLALQARSHAREMFDLTVCSARVMAVYEGTEA